MSADHLLIFRDAPESAEYSVDVLEGRVPDGLKGCLLRNGPGIQHAGDEPQHLLDGYGFIAGIFFDGQRPFFRARHVETPLWSEERAAQRQLFRKAFTNLPTRLANVLNVSVGNPAAHDVYAWGGKIFAADANGHFSLDGTTLATRGPSPLNAQLAGRAQLAPMPKVDCTRNRLLSYSLQHTLFRPDLLTFHEYDAHWKEVHQVEVALPGKNLYLHDLAFTPNFYIVVELGRLKTGSTLLGNHSVSDAIAFDDLHPLRLFVVPRNARGPLRQLPLPPGHQGFHLFNAFEREGQVVIDSVLYRGHVDFHDFYPPDLKPPATDSAPVAGPFIVRHSLDLQSGRSQWRVIEGVRGEAPAINPRRAGKHHRYGYAAAPTSRGDEPSGEGYFWFHGLAKIDFDQGLHQSWSAGPRTYCSPPAFVARPGAGSEDDGWLLAWVIDAHREQTQVVILDAKTPAMGPIARLGLRHLLPAVSHTRFVSAATQRADHH